MKTPRLLAAGLLCALLTASLDAQPPSRFGGRGGFADRDGDEDRGGPRGRGGFRGSRRGGEDDEQGGRGRFRSRGGGFDPSAMLQRLDRDGNGVLDPEEQQGPASFLVRRLQQSNPDIKAGQPIPLDRIRDSFDSMRRGRGGDDDADDRRGGDGDQSLEPQLLVPGFGVESTPLPLPGFGPSAELWSVPVSEQDEREAAERMRRYDRDRDGFLGPQELRRSRLPDEVMAFDRNRDGRLSASELAMRYAHRRDAEQRERRRDQDAVDRGRSRRGDQDEDLADPYGGRNSYRALATGEDRPAGLPSWFAEKDRNGDSQVAMAEYADRWNEALIAEFFRFDLNQDGLITAAECARAVRQGVTASASAAHRSAGAASVGGQPREGRPSAAVDSTASDSAPSESSVAGIDAETMQWAQDTVGRYDQNGDGVLTADEWKSMLVPPAGADADQDGRITAAEYAAFRQR